MAIRIVMAVLTMTSMSWAADERMATALWRGVEEFGKAKVADSTSAAVRQPGHAGKVDKNAVFLHPPGKGKATLDFPTVKVRVDQPSRLFFLGYAGMSDGIPWDDKERKPDGVRFYVAVNGKEAAQAHVRESRWTPLVADLGPCGRETEIALQLATDSGPNGNSSYDWAMFGEPLLVAVSEKPLAQAAAAIGTSGIVIVAARARPDRAGGEAGEGNGALVVEGLDAAGNAVKGAEAREPVTGQGFRFVAFDFAAHEKCVGWRWRLDGLQAIGAWGGIWPSALEVTSVQLSQAVVLTGEPLRMRVGLKNTGMGSVIEADGVVVECEGRQQKLSRLTPSETKTLEFELAPRPSGEFTVGYGVKVRGKASQGNAGPFYVWPKLPSLEAKRPDGAAVSRPSDGFLLIENAQVRWLVHTQAPGMAALVWAWHEGQWQPVGSAAPLVEWVDADGAVQGLKSKRLDAKTRIELSVTEATGGQEARLKAEGGHAAHVTVEMKLPANSEAMDVLLKAHARQRVALGALRGPAVCVGDRGTGAKKGQAFFPGLEYLEGDEPSSSTRDLAPPLHLRLVPHKFKVTVPLMMVETQPGGPAMAVVWDPRQKWDGEHSAPAACFASPNFVAQQDNHLMQLFVPSVPDYVAENERTASLKPYVLEPGKDLTLRQFIVAGKPPLDATGGFTWLDRLVGFPSAESWPRSFEDEMALCRHGFMKTVWDEASQKHLHYVGSGKANAPGFATLMLMDARAVAKGDEKRRLLERVKLVAEKTLREQGVGGLVSHALCHVMSGEFPYHWGHLPGALEGLRAQAYASLDSQEADGGWGYYPDEKRSKLGERGMRVIGISARHAYLMAKYAAITGDPEVLDGLKRALEHLRRFKVPRGAQGWECPILEPDVLASAYAVRAYVWTHIATGEERWLDDARYWARTGLAFQYAWDDAQHPGMRYASIPVFGSTFFTHTWIGLPVQWCGLVYAYALQELMRFDRHEWWRKQAEGITVSAMFQQWPMDSEKLAGSYPDSWGQWFTRRNPVHINPEDIAVNVLALKGLDPGLRSVGVKLGDGVVRLTAPADVKASVSGQQVQAEMKYVPGETFYATLAPVAVSEGTRIAVAEQVLPRRETLAAGETGWAYDARLKALAVGMKADAGGTARLTASGLSYSLPETPKLKVGWEFESDAEGWSAGHSCQVKAENGRLVITVTGHDPYALSGPAEIPANTHKRLRMRLRLSAGRGVALFWRSKQAPNWGPDKETLVNVSATGGWHEVTFDLSKHPLWAGKVLQLRLDPEPPDAAAGTTLEVDWIRAETGQ